MATHTYNKIARYALLLFVFLLPAENLLTLNSTPMGNGITILQVIGFVLFPIIAIVNFKYLSSIQWRLNLLLLLIVFLNISIDFWYGGISTFRVSLTLLQLYVMCFALTSYFSVCPSLINQVIESYGLGILVMFGLDLLGIGSINISNQPYVMGEDPNNFSGGVVIVSAYFIYRIINGYSHKGLGKNILRVMICVFMVFYSGSRGGLGALIVVFLVSILFFIKQHKFFILLLFMSIVIIFACVYLYYYAPEWYVQRWQRTIVSGDISGRDFIWLTYYNMILERPIFGWGLAGGYAEAGRRVGLLLEAGQFGRSAHNLYLAFIASVGIIGVVIFSVWSMTVILCAKRRSKNQDYILFWLMLTAVSVVNLSVSWERHKMLWIVIAYFMAVPSLSRMLPLVKHISNTDVENNSHVNNRC